MFKIFVDYLSSYSDIPGAGMFNYISFRGAMSIIFALLIGTIVGRKIIMFLRKRQIGEDIRNLGLQGQLEKKGTPTMGGIIVLICILIPTLLFCDLSNIYVQLMLISTVWLGGIGFADDYIKVYRKKKEGLKGRFKIIGQVGLGIIVGLTMWKSDSIVVRNEPLNSQTKIELVAADSYNSFDVPSQKRAITTIPFLKNHEFDYHSLVPTGNYNDVLGWMFYVLAAIFIITAVSNGANLTDGLDGLAAGTSAIIGAVLAIFAYVSGNVIYSAYLGVTYIPGIGELFVYCAAFVGALMGFLWYNCFPAQIFMGDTGSLAIGGIIAVLALLVRKELLLPILCGIFMIETISVMVQVAWFKYTKRKYGEGRRIFLMAPLHHHFQKKGFFEVKIVIRFWIIQLLLAAITLVTLKIR